MTSVKRRVALTLLPVTLLIGGSSVPRVPSHQHVTRRPAVVAHRDSLTAFRLPRLLRHSAAVEPKSASTTTTTEPGPPVPTPAPAAPKMMATVMQPAPQSAMTLEPSWVQGVFACIRYHESRTTPTAVNPTSGDNGLYQFSNVTWIANGGGQFAPEAMDATPAEQSDVAAWTYNAAGFTPWAADNACWGG